MAAFFFDLDGTLFDTRTDLAATVNHTRRDLGLQEWPLEDVIANVGQGARHLLSHSIPEACCPFENLWPIFQCHYAEHCCETLTPYPGVSETLEELARRGHRLGLNTNKPNFAVHAILAKFGFSRFFGEAVVAGGDCVQMKPSAMPLRLCAARMGVELSPLDWMVGDSWTDLDCAAQAGIRSVFCRFGFGVMLDSPCSFEISHISEILQMADV